MVSFKFLLLLLVQLALAAKMCPPDLTDAEIFEAAMKQEGPEAALELLQVQRVKADHASSKWRTRRWGHGGRRWGRRRWRRRGWGGGGWGGGGWGRCVDRPAWSFEPLRPPGEIPGAERQRVCCGADHTFAIVNISCAEPRATADARVPCVPYAFEHPKACPKFELPSFGWAETSDSIPGMSPLDSSDVPPSVAQVIHVSVAKEDASDSTSTADTSSSENEIEREEINVHSWSLVGRKIFQSLAEMESDDEFEVERPVDVKSWSAVGARIHQRLVDLDVEE
ncbi:unnamed protein product [Durusdinium trenchii]|uniref:Uncharacterized protein n=1 Tax=Durusdinium trenchii TaxID=1381693 RepID=A0ABP0QRB1_9DINO